MAGDGVTEFAISGKHQGTMRTGVSARFRFFKYASLGGSVCMYVCMNQALS